jgi:hypothetical protein
MKIRFTDQHKYPRGYVHSESTDIRRTFAAERSRMERAARGSDANVLRLKPATRAKV